MSIRARLFSHLAMVSSWLAAWRERANPLHTARWAYFHELAATFVDRLSGTQILLAKKPIFHGLVHRVVAVKPTKLQRELGHVLLVGKHRSGKGLNIETNLLTWPHSVIVNDIKGELYHRTAGYRATLGKVFRFDPRGTGARFDPLEGKTTDSELRSAATTLLYRADEGQNTSFTERAITMLVAIFTAAVLAGERSLPFAYQMMNAGLSAAATRLEAISRTHNAYPNLATTFLDIEYAKADFDSKFLQDCWSTLTARMRKILTKETVKCFTGSDVTAKEIITSPRPLSVYLSWPEEHVHYLAPLIRLVWDSLINGMLGFYDSPDVQGKGCERVLCVLDEIFRTGLPKLPEYTTTASGRNISFLISAQSIRQMEKAYDRPTAEVFLGQMDATVFYRPAAADIATPEYIERACGYTSGFAHSKTDHETSRSTGESEQRVPLMPAHESRHLDDGEIIGLVNGLHPFREKRLNRYEFPELTKRGTIPAPPVQPLPDLDLGRGRGTQFTLVGLPNGSDGERHNQGNDHQLDGNTLWHRERKLPNGYIDPDKRY
jgi:type IV secretion system protein VirD4